MYFHSVKTPEDESKLLEKLVNLNVEIRAKKERARLAELKQSEQYSKIFNPLTDSLHRLTDITSDITTDSLDAKEGTKECEPTGGSSQVSLPSTSTYELIKNTIGVRNLEDGKLGLNPVSQTIGEYTFSVEGPPFDGRITIVDGDKVKTWDISDENLWRVLLKKTPTGKEIKSMTIEARKIFREIILFTKLVESASYSVRKRKKFRQLLATGAGFLFTTISPEEAKKQSGGEIIETVIVPSDSKTLLSGLVKSLAETRAGNRSARKFLVAFAKAAKEKKILPPNLLTPEEQVWSFA